MQSLIKNFYDLKFTVVAIPYEYHVEFTIYDIEGYGIGESGEYDSPVWHRKDAPCHPDSVDSLEEAEPYLHGTVKWDGCSNWHFDEQDRVMLHGCSREDIVRYGEIMARCWDWTSELCPHFDK